jgi:hypothetical protein
MMSEKKYVMMSEKKYLVPEGGLNAAVKAAWVFAYPRNLDGHPQASPRVAEEIIASFRRGIEAFTRWQSENPQVPTDEQCDELIRLVGATGTSPMRFPSRVNRDQARTMLTEWQRRMYLANPKDSRRQRIIEVLKQYPDRAPEIADKILDALEER